jgi:hypothetical protein
MRSESQVAYRSRFADTHTAISNLRATRANTTSLSEMPHTHWILLGMCGRSSVVMELDSNGLSPAIPAIYAMKRRCANNC